MDRIGSKRPIRWFIREWREHRGLTQDQVAERLGTNRGQISKLERSSQRINDDWIAGFSEAFDVEPRDLLRDPNQPTPDDLLRSATPEMRNRVLTMINALLKAG